MMPTVRYVGLVLPFADFGLMTGVVCRATPAVPVSGAVGTMEARCLHGRVVAVDAQAGLLVVEQQGGRMRGARRVVAVTRRTQVSRDGRRCALREVQPDDAAQVDYLSHAGRLVAHAVAAMAPGRVLGGRLAAPAAPPPLWGED